MSDSGRKDLTTQAGEALKPESQKGYLEKGQEAATDLGDKVAATVQPGDNKSTTQKLSDTAQSGSNDTSATGKSYVEQAQEAGQNALNAVSNAASNFANSISGSQNK